MAAKLKTRLYCSAAVAMFACVGSAQAQEVETVVVTGQRAAIESAISIKQRAETIVDSVAADDIGKLPDNSITEVLQRVPGVNITRLQVGGASENYLGEGTGFSIRGLTSTVSLLNGRDAFSASSGRNLSWEDIPPELAQGVDIYKALQASLPEGGMGGVVNLRTRQPFDFSGLKVNVTATGNYADKARKGNIGGVGMISDRFDTKIGEIGVLFNIAYSKLTTKADGLNVLPYYPVVYNPTFTASNSLVLPSLSDAGSKEVYVPDGFGFNTRTDDRTRVGLYLATQWRPSDTLLIGLTAFNSRYTFNDTQYGTYLGSGLNPVLGADSVNTFNANGDLTSTTGLSSYEWVATPGPGVSASGTAIHPMPYNTTINYDHQVSSTTDVSLTAAWDPNDKFSANFALQYVDSSSLDNYSSVSYYIFLQGLGFKTTPYGDSKIPTVVTSSSMVDTSNPSNYGWLDTMPHNSHHYGREGAFYFDGIYKLSDTGLIRDIRSGVKLTYRNEHDNNTSYTWKQLSPYWGSNNHYASEDLTLATKVDLSNMFDGNTGLPSTMWFPSVAAAKTSVRCRAVLAPAVRR